MRVPLWVLIPVCAIAMAVAIGVGIGLTNLAIRDMTDSAYGPVAFAGGLTVLIMAVATYLHMTSPDPEDR
ncbi:MAG TPA: hypothetical protein VKZ96_11575 [Thermomicrobiales bacterium]|nr:hypothetical protein [Thermomicrobiales bacterium]